jgi:hypothetical protein
MCKPHASSSSKLVLMWRSSQDVCWWKQNMKWKWRNEDENQHRGKRERNSSAFDAFFLRSSRHPKWLHMSIAGPRNNVIVDTFDWTICFSFLDGHVAFYNTPKRIHWQMKYISSVVVCVFSFQNPKKREMSRCLLARIFDWKLLLG